MAYPLTKEQRAVALPVMYVRVRGQLQTVCAVCWTSMAWEHEALAFSRNGWAHVDCLTYETETQETKANTP